MWTWLRAHVWAPLWARRPTSWWRAAGVGLGYLLGWAVIAVPVAYVAFMSDERDSVIAGHDVVISPTHDGWATIDLGALLPDVRYPTDRTLGVTIDVGATNLDDYNALIARYAVIASRPDGEIVKVNGLVQDMAYDAMVLGSVIGLSGPILWRLVGRRRRRELVAALTLRRGLVIAAAAVVLVGVSVARPFEDHRSDASVAGSNESVSYTHLTLPTN